MDPRIVLAVCTYVLAHLQKFHINVHISDTSLPSHYPRRWMSFHVYQKDRGLDSSSWAPSWWASRGVQKPSAPAYPFLYASINIGNVGIYKHIRISFHGQCGIQTPNVKLDLHHPFIWSTAGESTPLKIFSVSFLAPSSKSSLAIDPCQTSDTSSSSFYFSRAHK